MPDKPIIDYPCLWEYKLIGLTEPAIRKTAGEVVDVEYTLTRSNASTSGKYQSMSLKIMVADEAMREGIFRSLKAHADIIMVL